MATFFKAFGTVHLFNILNENQLMSLFYSYIAGSLHVSVPQVHHQESSYSCSHNHWFSQTEPMVVLNSCTNSPDDGPVSPKHVEIQQYTNKMVTWVGFHSIRSFISLSYDRSKASSKASSPHSAIQSFLFQMKVSSPFLKVIQ